MIECRDYHTIILEGFKPLWRWHRYELGVQWWIYVRAAFGCEDSLYFCGFSRLEGSPKGNGRIALKEVCDLADKFDVPLTLEAIAKELFPYYESFGFVCQRKYRDGLRLYKREPEGGENEC